MQRNRVLNILKTEPQVGDPFLRITQPAAIPSAFSVEQYAPPTRDQGQEGSCGPQSATEVMYGLRQQFWKYLKNPIGTPDTLLSANDCYYRVRERMAEIGQDSGVDNRQLALSMVQDGMCTEESRPYDDHGWELGPTLSQNTEAVRTKAGAFHFIKSARDICTVIASGYPGILGMSLYESYMGDEVEKTGIVPMPQPGEKIEGGHDESYWGYDLNMKVGNTTGFIKLLNHWSADWGCLGGPADRQQRGWNWVPLDLVDLAMNDPLVLHFGHPW